MGFLLEKTRRVVRAEIISIGTEIVLGRVVNTNQSFLARMLLLNGFYPSWSTVVNDAVGEIKKALSVALKRADLIILTGGLGSTPDDLTRQAIARDLNLSFKLCPEAENEIRRRLKGADKKRLNFALKQAYVPEGSQVSFSSSGTAPGFLFIFKEKVIVALPGVPDEAKEIFMNFLPYLELTFKNRTRFFYQVLRTYGLSEAEVFQSLKPFLNEVSQVELGYLPVFGGVDIELMSESKEPVESLAKIIKSQLKTFIYGEGSQTLSGAIGKLLLKRNLTLSVAESCTAGLLSAEIVRQPGSSRYFLGGIIAYSNDAKKQLLKVGSHTLNKHGAVSEPCAYEMAENVRKIFQTEIGLSTTGLAGPSGGASKKPVGLVYLGLSTSNFTRVWEKKFTGSREEIRLRAVYEILNILRLHLKGLIK